MSYFGSEGGRGGSGSWARERERGGFSASYGSNFRGGFGGSGGCRSRKFYAVAKGRKLGIFSTWQECQSAVSEFAGPKFKSFPTLSDAHSWMQNEHKLAADSYSVAPGCFLSEGANHGAAPSANSMIPKSVAQQAVANCPAVTKPATNPATKPPAPSVQKANSSTAFGSNEISTNSSGRRKIGPSAIDGGYAGLRALPPKNGKDGAWCCDVLASDGEPCGMKVEARTAEQVWRVGLTAALESGAIKVTFEDGPWALEAFAQTVRYLSGWKERGWKTSKGRPLKDAASLERLHALLARPHPFLKRDEAGDDFYHRARKWVALGDLPRLELAARRKGRPNFPEKADNIRQRFLLSELLLTVPKDAPPPPPVLEEPAFDEWLIQRKADFKAALRVDEAGQKLYYEETDQHDPRWFEGRAYRASASKAGHYTGTNKYDPFERFLTNELVWEEYGKKVDELGKARMANGNLREPDARCRHREARLRQIWEVEAPLAKLRRPGWTVLRVEWESYVGGVWLPTDPALAGLACSDDGIVTERWHWAPSFSSEAPTPRKTAPPRIELDDRNDKLVRGTVFLEEACEREETVESVTYLAEYKCPEIGAYDEIPPYYADQVQYVLGMRGLPFGHFGVWGEASFRFDRLDFDPNRYEFILRCMLDGQDKFYEGAVLKAYGISRYPEVNLEQVRQRIRLEEDQSFAEPATPEEEPLVKDQGDEICPPATASCPNSTVETRTCKAPTLSAFGLVEEEEDVSTDDPNQFVPQRDAKRPKRSNNRPVGAPKPAPGLQAFGLVE